MNEHVIAGIVEVRPMAPLGWAALGAGAALAGAAWATWRRRGTASRGRLIAVAALRVAVILGALMILLRPAILRNGRREVQGEIAFLVDASRSHRLPDAAGVDGRPLTRAEAVREAFLASGREFLALGEKRSLRAWAFGGRLRTIGTFAPPAEDERTDLEGALARLLAMTENAAGTENRRAKAMGPITGDGPRLTDVVLVTDGRATHYGPTSAEALAAELAARGVRVHAVGVGSAAPDGRLRDWALRDLRTVPRAFAGSRVPVRVVASALGCAGQGAEAVLTVDGREVARQRLAPEAHREQRELVFEPVLETPGLHEVAVEIAPVEAELTDANNRAEARVRVEPGGVRVLYLEGTIRPEGKYIARALGGAAELELERRILVGPRAAEAAPTPAELDAFDVVVLGDLPARALPPKVVEHLASRVRAGRTGLLAAGGLSALGAGGWERTPLALLLPVRLAAEDAPLEAPVRMSATVEGRRHFVLCGVADAPGPAADWSTLPPLAGANRLGPPMAGATCLARDESGAPLLAVRELGTGRTAVLAADTTWQWVLAPGEAEGPAMHARLWRHLALWLAGRDRPPEGELWVMTDRLRYALRGDVPPAVEVTVAACETPAAVTWTGPDGQAAPLAREPGTGRAVLRPRLPGTYTLTARATVCGEARTAEAAFVVTEHDFETAEVTADHASLARVAAAGGGTFRTLPALGGLLAELAADAAPITEPVVRRAHLAEGRLFLALLVAAMAGEWAMVRRGK